MNRILFFAIIVFLSANPLFAQRQSIFVNPQTTDPEIDIFLSPHYAARNPASAQRNRLMVFFPGTNGTPFNYRTFTNLAAEMGFHALGLSYVNGDAVNELCGPTLDLNCYGNVRLEIFDGTDRSALVSVNRPNSIENRLTRLLIYLQQINPAANWAQYLDANNQVRWENVVVAGHSQGGGHAGIIGKNKLVTRVIMFAAMDFNGFRNSVANWILSPGVTPNSGFYGFSHQQDEEVNYTILSTRAWAAYGMNAFGAAENVESVAPPFNHTHSLNTNFLKIPGGSNYHGAVVVDTRFPVDQTGVSIYEPVWRYLLETNAPLILTTIQFLRQGQPVNRPPVGLSARLFNLSVQGSGFGPADGVWINGIETETEYLGENELRAKLPAGKIGGVGNSTVQIRTPNGQVSNVLTF